MRLTVKQTKRGFFTVENAETGEQLEDVQSVTWRCNVDGYPIVTIELMDIEIKIDHWRKNYEYPNEAKE